MQQLNRSLNHFFLGIVVAVFITGESLSQDNTDWKSRLFEEAPKHWESYLHFASSLQFAVRSNRYLGANRKPLAIGRRAEYKQTEGASLRVDYGPKGQAEVEGANPSYSFKLIRRSSDKGWIIADLNDSDQSTRLSDKQKKIQERRRLQAICDCLLLDSHLWLPTLIQDPDFKITAIKPQELDGRPVIRFDFDYRKPDQDYPVKGSGHVKGGWMVLDPEHDWILREYMAQHSQAEKGYMVNQIFQIREGTDRHPIITHCTHQILYKRQPSDKEFEIGAVVESDWQVVERSEVPLEEFTLSVFGLPEPPGIEMRKSRLHLWIALVGIVCVGVAALIRWRLRRTRAAC